MFNVDKQHKDGRTSQCKECIHIFYVENRKKILDHYAGYRSSNKEKIRAYNKNLKKIKTSEIEKLKTPCIKCGFNDARAIDFHHVDPSKKLFVIGTNVTRSSEALYEEAAKCVCLCSNCHRIYHAIYGKVPKDPIASFEEFMKED